MVLYFSGTGNSQLVAIQIAKIIGDNELISINQYLKKGEHITIKSKNPLVFVAPTYCWRLPKIVERWILEATFTDKQEIYFILTCGDSCGNAAIYAEKLCMKKNLHFCGLASVTMPENYLALFPTPNKSESQTIIENARPRIDALAQNIRSGQPFVTSTVSIGDKLKSGPINPLFYTFFVHDKGFWVSDHCISCKKCALRCPLNNINIVNGKPIWKGDCTHCMACIGGCPTEAIQYKTKSKQRHRHYIMNDVLCLENGGEKNEERAYYSN